MIVLRIVDIVISVIESLSIFFYYKYCFDFKNQNIKNVIISFCCILASDILITIFNFNWWIQALLFVVINSVLLKLFFRGELPEKILHMFFLLFIIPFSSVIMSLLLGKTAELNYSDEITIENIECYTIKLFIGQLLIFILLSLLVSIKRKVIFYLSKTELNIVILQFCFSLIVLFIIHKITLQNAEQNPLFMLIILAVLIMNIMIYYMVLILSKTHQKEIIQTQKITILEQQEKQLENICNDYNEIKKLKHDINNYISCSLILLQNKEYNELKKYLEKFSDMETLDIVTQISTKSKIINAVLNMKISTMNKNNIKFNCIVQDNCTLFLEIELSIILLNILDNAIDACLKVDSEKEIILNIYRKNEYLCLKLDNSVSHNILKDNPNLLTSKDDSKNHGIGTMSVKDIVKKNNGMIHYQCNDKIFTVKIAIPQQK